MLGNLRGWEWLIILVIVLLLFGARRLPDLTRSVARSLKIFRTEVKDTRADEPAAATSTTTDSSAGVPPAAAGSVPPSTPVVTPEDRVAPTTRPGSDDDGERPRP